MAGINPLLGLLQAVTGIPLAGGAPANPAADPSANDEILVTAQKRQPPPENDPAPPGLVNRSYLEEAQDAAAKAPQRQGMFHTKGTLRDILGTLGDAFLVQSGNKQIYRPQREKEKLADAMVGITDNPMAAIERVSNVDAEAGAKLFDNWQQNQIRQQQQQSLEASRRSNVEVDKQKRTQDFGNYAARVLSGAKSPAAQEAAMRLLTKRSAALGIDLSDIGIEPDMSPEEIAALASGDMTVQQQQQLPIAQQNADAHMISARKAPAPRVPPNPTAVSAGLPLIKKAEKLGGFSKLSPGEKDTLRSLGLSPDRGSKKRPMPDLPPGFKVPTK